MNRNIFTNLLFRVKITLRVYSDIQFLRTTAMGNAKNSLINSFAHIGYRFKNLNNTQLKPICEVI